MTIENTTTTTYQGWKNYATWRVNLEICDELMNAIISYNDECDRKEYGDATRFATVIDLADHLMTECEQIIDEQCDPGTLANGYATAFLNQVDWYEIASTYVADNPTLIADESANQ